MRRVAIVAAAALALGPAAAWALDADQKGAIDRLATVAGAPRAVASALARHYAMLLWVEDACDGKSSTTVRTYLQEKGDVDPKAFDDGWADTVDMLGKTDPKAMCALALELYGPQGTLIGSSWQPRSDAAR